ncbi:predicted protein [Naegleria gruberi]|uniref:Predicted protein n=1 Tax=Naegleria gruberi TaxID=5762 RepID=D2W453_NAEGR|nr:uncharacterized protein NAEGRDRAFT_54550 [Naegleria gruberi]EFC36159.1 predicted protein [Naegleria gruberi]|eukprot:XP_002668903.1 predicted protein [Naegleria gruberi strain NEG-M]
MTAGTASLLSFLFLFVICCSLIHQLSALSFNNISTIVGGGSFIGDGLISTNALLNYPSGMAMYNGDLLIADSFNHRIRKVSFSSSGVISTIAGIGSSSFSGDGGLAINAELNFPSGVAVHSNGDVYIADKSNHVIRKVSALNGKITTIAGIAGETELNKYSNSLATNTTLNSPQYLAVNSSTAEVIISDTNNNVIRKVYLNGTIVTIAGVYGSSGYSGDNGNAVSAKLFNPKGIIINSIGEIIFADSRNHRIRKISKNGKITTIAGTGTAGLSGDGGLATSAKLNYPNSVALEFDL